MSIRKQVRSALFSLGLGVPAAFVGRMLTRLQEQKLALQFPTDEHQIFLDGKVVKLVVKDAYTRGWLYPRYAGGRLHEPPVTRLFAQKAAQAKRIADVGANLGWFTCIAAVLQPQGDVTAFELDSGFTALVRQNLRYNGCGKADVVNAAVGAQDGEITYVRSGAAHPGLSLKGATKGVAVTAQVVCLDSWYSGQTPPDLFKIDVEGAEMDVLRGMTGILQQARPILFIELHPRKLPDFGEKIEDVLSFLESHGYKLYKILDWREGEDVKLEPLQEPPTANDMLYAEPQ